MMGKRVRNRRFDLCASAISAWMFFRRILVISRTKYREELKYCTPSVIRKSSGMAGGFLRFAIDKFRAKYYN